MDTMFRSISKHYIDYFSDKMVSNKNVVNQKVVDFSSVNFIFIFDYMKKLQLFEDVLCKLSRFIY
jgi:multisubunit Na+/H+ antiporter MnhB subunit